MSRRSALLVSCGFFLLSMVSCSDDDIPSVPDERTPPRLCAPSAPESLLCNIEVLYNDQQRKVSERLPFYDDLFSRDFIFRFQRADLKLGPPASWGIKTEVEAHRGMFTAQDEGEFYSLKLSMIYDPALDLPPQPGREGWKMIFVNHYQIRLMFSPEDGVEISGGQAEFLFPPPVGGRWTIGEWIDLPRPAPGRVAVGPTTWGSWGQLKAKYLP